MIRVLLPSLLMLASAAAMARAPRFLGPPVKKPADAGPAEPCDGGEPDDAGAAHGEARPPVPEKRDAPPAVFIVERKDLP